jgi:xanthine/CO dehydrogenase XdhC/CoxF family maturation factor
VPVVDFATRLGWSVIAHDHRPAYADGARFPAAARVVLGRPEALAGTIDLGSVDAAVVMSHHLESDAAYLRALAASRVPYVGLLGPAPRRERLRAAIGPELAVLDGRLRSPVGLNLGGRASTSIALAIVAEIHAFVHRRPQVSS